MNTQKIMLDTQQGIEVPMSKESLKVCCPNGLKQPLMIWAGTWNIAAKDPFNAIDDGNDIIKCIIPCGYDIYVFGVQEGSNENIYNSVIRYLNNNHESKEKDMYSRINLESDAVFGYGDMALLSKKFTGIAVYVKKSILSRLSSFDSSAHGFGRKEGSKGGVAVKFCVDKITTLSFVSCHLEANNVPKRREQIHRLDRFFARSFNFEVEKKEKKTKKTLSALSGHLIWMGDFNYRITELKPEDVLTMLRQRRHKELLEKYDPLRKDINDGLVFTKFKEANMVPDFYPTYKKKTNRGFVNFADDLTWPNSTYVTKYEIPVYKRIFKMRLKKSSVKCPGWPDRILFHSLKTSNSPHILKPEQICQKKSCNEGTKIDNYAAINNGFRMDVSDHSPVYCTFKLSQCEGIKI